MDLTESLENYLKAILTLSREKKTVRVKDLMEYFGYKVSSVNEAVSALKARGLVEHEKYGDVTLTQSGFPIAEKVLEKYNNFYRFFHDVIGTEEKTAWDEACRVEHILSKETYERFNLFLSWIQTIHPGEELSQGINDYLKTRSRECGETETREECVACPVRHKNPA